MNKLLTTTFAILLSINCFSQINIDDSTAQTIGYWDKKETQHYLITTNKYKLKNNDTTSREVIKYEVDITILDSTEKSYTISWKYNNFDVKTENELMKKLYSITDKMEVIIKTDEMGAFEEVVNWQAIRDFNKKAIAEMKKMLKDVPNMDDVLKKLEKAYSSKETIESASIADIQQFYSFHGAKFKMGETIEGTIKLPNLLGGEPFDTKVAIYMDEMDAEEGNYIVRSEQEVDREQLTEATYKYLVELSKTMKIDPPKRSDLKDLKNETLIASRIHDSGWIMYSIQTKTVSSEDVTNVEEREIEIE